MKRKKLLLGAFSLLSVFALASCGNDELQNENEELKAGNEALKAENEE